MSTEIKAVTHTEKVIAGEVQPVTHLEKVIAEYGGGGGGGFTPTTEQLAAMNSGITSEDVEQIATNENNISLEARRISALQSQINQMSTDGKKITPAYIEMQSVFWGGMLMPSSMTEKNCSYTFDCSEGDTIVTVISSEGVDISEINDTVHWFCGWITYDGINYDICNLRQNTTSTLEIYPPCKATATGVAVGNAIFDGSANYVATHLSMNGYKTYMQKIYNTNPKYTYVGEYIAKFNPESGDAAPFTAYGGQKYTSLYTVNRTLSWLNNYTKRSFRLIFDKSYTPHTTKTGVKWSVQLGGKTGYLEIFVAPFAKRLVLPSDQTIFVEFSLDGVIQETVELKDTICKRLCFDFSDADIGEINIYGNKWAPIDNDSVGFYISNTTWWITDNAETKIIPDYTVCAQEFDSWGIYHHNASAAEMERLIKDNSGVYVQYENHSSAGKTSAWGMGWFYENVKKYNPSMALFDFVINDTNSIGTPSIPETIEGSDGTVYNNKLTSSQYAENMEKIINMCIASGIKPVVILATIHGSATYNIFSNALIEHMSYLSN